MKHKLMFGGLTGVKLTTSLIALMWTISLCAIKVKRLHAVKLSIRLCVVRSAITYVLSNWQHANLQRSEP